MDAVEQPPSPPSENANKRARASQACRRCRSLKARCVPADNSDWCQRCVSANKSCVWPEVAQPPVKRTRVSGTSRIAQMEQRIEGLVALLSEQENAGARHSPTTDTTAGRLQARISPESHHNATPKSTISSSHQSPTRTESRPLPIRNSSPQLHDIHTFDAGPSRAQRHGSIQGHPPIASIPYEPGLNHEVVKRLIASSHAEALLNEYRSMSIFFPFVPIAATTTAQGLNQQEPMLLLAMLTAASWKDRPLQLTLEEQYRLELASRTVIRPRKTLGMIHCILVHLAWYHFYFAPKTQQLNSLLQLAIGLTIDLGIYQKSKKSLINISGRENPSRISPSEEREMQRTLLGCYYLSSAFSSALTKPNLLRYSDYMTECGQRLRDDLEYPSDEMLGQLVALRRIDDQIYDTFHSEGALSSFNMHSQIHLKLLESQMQSWRDDQIHADTYRQVCDLSYFFTDMSLHDLGTRLDSGSTANPNHINILLNSFEAGKKFLDSLLAIPSSQYHLISFVEWMRLPYILIILSKLSFPSESHIPGWDVRVAQDRVRLDLYLESLCYRMQNLTTFKRPAQPLPDFWLSMNMIMEKTKTWYIRKTKPTTDGFKADEESPFEHLQNPVEGLEKDAQGSTPGRTRASSVPGINGLQHQTTTTTQSLETQFTGDFSTEDFGLPDMDQFEDFLDGGMWGAGGGFDASMFQGDELSF